MTFKELCVSVEEKIQTAYTEGVTLEEAEKLAGEFLYAQLEVSRQLKTADLDARMRKTGVKAVRAAIYNEVCATADKKPTEGALEHLINLNEVVQQEQNGFDTAEANRDDLGRYYQIFREAHIFFRGVSRGKFD